MDKLRIMIIGAHPDDCEIKSGGYAYKMAKLGHIVRFYSVSDGSCGHQSISKAELAAIREEEMRRSAQIAGIEFEIGDIRDGEVDTSLENRTKVVRAIRRFSPHIVFCHRPNDYHVDHRNSSMLVQDASYMLLVPKFCPDTPRMEKMPVIMYFHDHFQNPPFVPDVVVDIGDVIDEKFKMMDAHKSQFYDWLPWVAGTLDEVPDSPEERLAWLRQPLVPEDRIITQEMKGKRGEVREFMVAEGFRDLLLAKYGHRGEDILFCEAFKGCEYGTRLDETNIDKFFPF